MPEKFFKSLDCVGFLRWVLRPRAVVREALLLQQTPDRDLIEFDIEALLDDLLEVDATPAHHAVLLDVGPSLHDLAELGLLLGRQLRLGAGSLGVDQPFRTALIEGMHPIPQRLAIHAADAGRLVALHAILHGSKRQQPPDLIGIPGLGELP